MVPIDKARERLGDKESPPNSNRTLYGKWFGMDGQPWCMFFVQWCYAMTGYPIPYKTGSCSELLRWYKANYPDRVLPNTAPVKGNDIIIYNFGHTGLVERDAPNSNGIIAIEGNTSSTDSGSQSDGGMVCRKVRRRTLVTAFIRPYDFEKGVEDMTKKEFIDSLTPEEAYKLFFKAMSYTDKKEQASWSVKEGYWDSAMKKGIIKVNNPESPIKRGEVVAILGRMGLLK